MFVAKNWKTRHFTTTAGCRHGQSSLPSHRPEFMDV
jgi:hypothetical protein